MCKCMCGYGDGCGCGRGHCEVVYHLAKHMRKNLSNVHTTFRRRNQHSVHGVHAACCRPAMRTTAAQEVEVVSECKAAVCGGVLGCDDSPPENEMPTNKKVQRECACGELP